MNRSESSPSQKKAKRSHIWLNGQRSCPTCGRWYKPASEASYCPECHRKRCQAWREKNRARANSHARAHHQRHYKPHSENPQRQAIVAVYLAVKAGRLTRPSTCSRCSSTERIEAHHHRGYDHPLDVKWLCRLCHKGEHVRLREEVGHAAGG